VGIELPCQIGVVRYHPSIVKYKSTRIFLECSPIIVSPVNSIAHLHLACRNPTLAKCGGEAQHLEKL
jgi:hypothetical protein